MNHMDNIEQVRNTAHICIMLMQSGHGQCPVPEPPLAFSAKVMNNLLCSFLSMCVSVIGKERTEELLDAMFKDAADAVQRESDEC